MLENKADVNNTELVIAYKDCSDFSLDNLRYLLDVCPTKIVVIYDEKEPKDYILNDKIRYIKNQGGRCWSKIHNQGIRETESQYVILSAWRSRPKVEHFQKVFDNLNNGFAFVDLCLLHFTALNKQVVGKFGLFDEGFKLVIVKIGIYIIGSGLAIMVFILLMKYQNLKKPLLGQIITK